MGGGSNLESWHIIFFQFISKQNVILIKHDLYVKMTFFF